MSIRKPAEPPLCEHKSERRQGDGVCRKCYKKQNMFKFLLRHRYGTTLEWYRQRLDEQGGVCAICKGVSLKRLGVDHNHQTGEVRGLLCVKCNAGIGNFNENPSLMYAAVQYLGRWS